MRTIPELKSNDVVSLAAVLREIAGEGIDEALELAMFAHEGTTRKELRNGALDADPYVIHPIRVALRIARHSEGRADLAQLQAALLHDAVEDAPERVLAFYGAQTRGSTDSTEATVAALARIDAVFGGRVAAAVAAVSNPDFSGLDPAQKNAAYAAHLVEAVAANPMAVAIKASDLVDNAGSLKHMAPGPRQSRLADKYRVPVRVMIDNAVRTGMAGLAARLERVLDSLEAIPATTAAAV